MYMLGPKSRAAVCYGTLQGLTQSLIILLQSYSAYPKRQTRPTAVPGAAGCCKAAEQGLSDRRSKVGMGKESAGCALEDPSQVLAKAEAQFHGSVQQFQGEV